MPPHRPGCDRLTAALAESTQSGPLPLAGIRVVEFTTGIAGPFAGRFLADAGAEVVKVEPPGGDPARGEGPFPGDVVDRERSGAFLYLNPNKRALVADPDRTEDRTLISRLLDEADLVIEGENTAALSAWGFAADDVAQRWPRLSRLSVTGFGLDGPYAAWRSSEIVAYAMGGPMHTAGMAGREPHEMAGNVIQMQCGNMAAVAGFAALTVAERSGRGIRVDVANFETQAGSIDRRMPYLVWHRFTGRPIPRQGGHRAGLIPGGVYPSEDGYVQVLAAPGWLPRLAAMLGDDEVIARFADPDWMDDDELPVLLDTALHVWSLGRDRYAAQEEAQALGLGGDGGELPGGHPRRSPFPQPRLLARARPSGGRALRRTRAAVPHGRRLVAAATGAHARSARAGVARRVRRPVTANRHRIGGTANRHRIGAAASGIRVLDLTLVWAGPYGTMLLGDLGAEAIRVDNPKFFPTATRGAIPRPRPGKAAEAGPIWGSFPNDDPGRRPWNRVGGFIGHARSKLGVTLDLRSALGRETFLRLVEKSDIIVENNSAKVLGNLGIDGDGASDRWVVLTVTDDADWAALRRAMGDPSWADDERFASAAGRQAHHDEIDGHLTAWTTTSSRHEIAARLQAEGVADGQLSLDFIDADGNPL